MLEGQCARASKPLACSILGTCWWVTTGAAGSWETAVVLDAEEGSYIIYWLLLPGNPSWFPPLPPVLCQDRSGACCHQQQDKFTNLHGDHRTLLPLHYCSSPRVRWRAWAAWGSYIFWQELVMDYIIVARITKRLMWLSRCFRHRIATGLRFHVHDASHDPTLESIHVYFTPYIQCTLLLSCDGGYVYTFAKVRVHAAGVHFTGGLGEKSAMFSTPDDHQVPQFILCITLRKRTQSLQACTTTECGFSYTKRPWLMTHVWSKHCGFIHHTIKYLVFIVAH